MQIDGQKDTGPRPSGKNQSRIKNCRLIKLNKNIELELTPFVLK